MTRAEYERLINRGFRIYKKDAKNIYIKKPGPGWSIFSKYSEQRWIDLLNDDKSLQD